MALKVIDALGAQQSLSTTTDAANNLVGATSLTDPTSGNKAQVAVFHNSDNQNPGNTSYGLLTGGVAQLINQAGNLDRQRETGVDGASAVGIASGATSMAMQFKTSVAANVAIGSSVVTPAVMSGNVGGVLWSIQVGSTLVVDSGASKETVLVTAANTTTFTAVFAKSHTTTPFNVLGFVYNQARDASGEIDGATGSGTAVAAEYEYNGGDPSGGNFDRARSLNAKGFVTATISGNGGVGNTSVFLSGSPTGLTPGTKILLYKSGTFPAAGSFESVQVDLSYQGGTTVPLASAIVGTPVYDTLAYDGFAAMGPGLSGFLPFGVGIEEEALYDPVSGKYYIERAATQDAMPTQNIVAESEALYNGATMDRRRGNVDQTLATLSAASASGNSGDQTNYNGRGVQIGVNITAITGTTPTLVVTVQGKDVASGSYYTLLASATLNSTGFTLLTVYPGAPTTANVSTPQVLPRTFRILYTIGGTTPAVTATIGASIIV